MLELDGSLGEGGGQILRSSMALAILTQTPIRIRRIRAGRAKPGLQRQHLVAVQAAARISQGELDGDELNSTELTFRPGQVVPGDFRFSTGSAGSTTLVLQTILPVLWSAAAPSRIQIEGGTHNPFAPPFDFLAHAFLPQVERMGPTIQISLDRFGFYPRGGGSISIEVTPVQELKPIRILKRGEVVNFRGEAVVVGLPREIAEREAATLARHLKWTEDRVTASDHEHAVGVGNYIAVLLESEAVCEVFTILGERGVRGEDLARTLAKEVRQHLETDVPVGEYLADQLLLPMALAGGGEFITRKPSLHTTTNIETIQKFLNVKFDVEELAGERHRISVSRC